VTGLVASSGALGAAVLLLQEGEHATGFLGIPTWAWQLANLVLFLAVLLYFVARPMSEGFRRRQMEVFAGEVMPAVRAAVEAGRSNPGAGVPDPAE